MFLYFTVISTRGVCGRPVKLVTPLTSLPAVSCCLSAAGVHPPTWRALAYLKFGLGAVVKQLKEVDSDGAPLLFHAASSRRQHSCFRTVHDLIYAVLGEGGLMEQATAVDGLGRGIIMHAARSSHVEAFRNIFDMRQEATESLYDFNQTSTKGATDGMPEATAEGSVFREVIGQFDHLGKSCLHHAAEAGCSAVLYEVIAKCGGAGSSLFQEMNQKADMFQRTPIMLVLANTYGGEEYGSERSALKDKFDMLFEAIPCGPAPTPGGHHRIGWMEPMSLKGWMELRLLRRSEGSPTRAVTELLHAVLGGLPALQLALNNSLPASKAEGDGGLTVDVDDAIAVETLDDDGRWVRSDEANRWGRAMLLAAAVKRGDIDVLFHVLFAIEVSEHLLENENNHNLLQA